MPPAIAGQGMIVVMILENGFSFFIFSA